MEQKDTHDEKKAVSTNCIKSPPVTTSSRKNNYNNNTTTATSTSSVDDNKKTTYCSPRKASTPVTNKSVTIRSLSTKIKEATMINKDDEAERMDKNGGHGGHGVVLGRRSNATSSSLLKNLALCSSSTTGTTIVSSKKSSGHEIEQEPPSNNNKEWCQEPPSSSPLPPQQPASGDRESIETPSSVKKNPYLNKTIRIINGQFEGLTGKIVKIHSRGWWTIDNPALAGKNVHPRFCELVDKIDASALVNFYGKRPKGRGRGLPSIVLRQQEQEIAKKKRRREATEKERKQPSVSSPPQQETWGQRMRPKTRRVTSSAKPTPHHCSSTSSPVARERRAHANDKTTHRHRQTCASSSKQHGGLGRTKRVLITSIVATKGDSPSKRVGLHPPTSRTGHKKKRRRTTRTNQQVLPPFLLNSQDDDYQAHEALRHLPPDYKVEIFNRKTGRILKGSDAVTSKDLPSVLRCHAEYEPLIPQREKKNVGQQVRHAQEVASREARSSANARINEHVQPQTKVRASTAEGRRVKITAGPYCGLTGKVESCIPGNWYLVSDLSKKNKFDFDYIVHANSLEMLVERPDTGNHQKKKAKAAPGEVEKDLTSLKKLIKSLEQKIHNLEGQKAFLLSSSGSSDKELAKKDEQLRSAREKLDVKNIAYKMLEGK